MAKLIAPSVRKSVFRGLLPSPIMSYFLRKTSKDVIKNVEKIVDVKDLVVKGMCTDPRILGSFFQNVGAKELRFLVDSGVGLGFLLGVVQMLQVVCRKELLYFILWFHISQAPKRGIFHIVECRRNPDVIRYYALGSKKRHNIW